MYHRTNDSPGNWRTKRRPTRFRATVERLDSRQLLAASVTATPFPVTGNAGTPLRVVELSDVLLDNPMGADAPLGTPIPLVSLSSTDKTTTLPAADYSGTVNWGDGTATDTAVFGTFNYLSATNDGTQLTVNGPEHTYATPGTYTITVSVTASGATTPTVYTDTATIGNIPTITGNINPTSRTNPTGDATADNTPNFLGTTQPGAVVVIDATSLSTGQTLLVGYGNANASGNWSITTIPLVDGSYSLTASSLNTAGLTASTSVAYTLTIDTAGPQITNFQVTNAKTGAFQVTYSDPANVLLSSLFNTSAYTVNRPSPTPKKGQTFPVTSLTATNIPDNYFFNYPTVTIAGTIGTGKALITGNGTYTYTIHSAGIVGVSGAALDGEYNGKFPTGNGVAGGDFQVKVNVKNGKVAGLIKITPAKVSPLAVKAKAVSKHQA